MAQKWGGWVVFVSPATNKSGRTLFPAWSYVLLGWAIIVFVGFSQGISIRLRVVDTALGLVFIMMGHQIEVNSLLGRVERLELKVAPPSVCTARGDTDEL